MPVSGPTPSGALRFLALTIGSGLVDNQPIETQLLDYAAEFLEVHRLLQITVDAELVTIHQVALLAGRGEHDHRNALGGHSTLHFPEHLDAIYLGSLRSSSTSLGNCSGRRPMCLPREKR